MTVSDLSLSFSDKKLFENVNLKFTLGNCYGIIGANGAGKSTFLKILSGEIQPDKGAVSISSNTHIGVLQQNQNLFDEHNVLTTIFMGHERFYKVMKEKDAIYEKEDFSEKDGLRAAELEEQFANMGGWEAESEVGVLLSGLGLSDNLLQSPMESLEPSEKIRVLLAQALFGNPDILLLDEPTNGLDIESIQWLEEFLIKFANIAIVVSHNRHFLNTVCTYTLDIDFGQIRMYVGNYDFWYESSTLITRQIKQDEKKAEKKKEELQEFIRRFSAHKARARQATSRKKLLDKLEIDQLPRTARKFPYINFTPERECGKSILEAKNMSVINDGTTLIENFSLQVVKGQKIAFVGGMNLSKTALFEVLARNVPPDTGNFEWGSTISLEYYSKDHSAFFDTDMNVFEWLSTYTDSDDDRYIRGFLGRMLFSGDDIFKKVKVLSGGEKARCMFSKIMLMSPNVIILDEPTSHLDLEAITSLNNALIDFNGVLLFNSHDQQFVDSIANRIVEFTPSGVIDQMTTFTEYIENERITKLREEFYHHHDRLSL